MIVCLWAILALVHANGLVNNVRELRRSKQTKMEKSYINNFLSCIVEDEFASYYDAIKSYDAPFC